MINFVVIRSAVHEAIANMFNFNNNFAVQSAMLKYLHVAYKA